MVSKQKAIQIDLYLSYITGLIKTYICVLFYSIDGDPRVAAPKAEHGKTLPTATGSRVKAQPQAQGVAVAAEVL